MTTKTKPVYRTFSREGHALEDALSHIPDRAYDWADALVEAAADGERREAIERVWQLFVDHGWAEVSISPKELHEALVAVLNEERDA